MLTVCDHIEVDEKGVARIAGSRIKVYQLIQDHKQWGWGAEEIHAQFPHLSLAQVHAAFVYYYDYREEVERAIGDAEIEVARVQKEIGKSQPTLEELKSRLGK